MRWWSLLVGLVGVLLTLRPAAAELYVCGDASTFTQAFYRDPTAQRPPTCSLVPAGQVQAQLELIASVQPPQMNPARYDYLKVPAGLIVIKTQSEKDAVDAALAAKAAEQQELAQERATNVFCNQQNIDAGTTAIAQRKAELYAKIDTIQAVNVATMKAGLKQVVDELAVGFTLTTNCFTGRKGGS